MGRDVAEAEVVRDEGVRQAEDRDADEGNRAVRAEASRLERARPAVRARGDERDAANV